MLERSFRIADAIVALIKGKISEEELVLLDKWINESEENKKLFLQFMDEQKFMRKKQDLSLREKSLDSIHSRFCRKKNIFYMKRVVSVAAVVTVVIGSFLYWKALEKNVTIAQYDIPKEKILAHLYLASGEKISLLQNTHDTVIMSKTQERIILAKGQLSIKADTSDKMLQENYHEIDVPERFEYQLTLSDGSLVWLNAGAHLKFPGEFTNGIRRIELYGEAYFEIAKDSLHPFIISTAEADIRVLGTSLNVRHYNDQPVITTLLTGSVEVVTDNQNKKRLKPGQQAITYKGKTSVQEVETIYYTAWKDGYFMFKDTALKTIIEVLCDWYDMQYQFTDSYLEHIHITARLKKYDHIDSVLNVLSKTEGIRITKEYDTLLIEPK